jgi:hypothetical protein
MRKGKKQAEFDAQQDGALLMARATGKEASLFSHNPGSICTVRAGSGPDV